MTTLRWATISDAAVISAFLGRHIKPVPPSIADLELFLRAGSNGLLMLKSAGRIRATLGFTVQGATAYLCHCAVDSPNAARDATAALPQLEAACRARHAAVALLRCERDSAVGQMLLSAGYALDYEEADVVAARATTMIDLTKIIDQPAALSANLSATPFMQ